MMPPICEICEKEFDPDQEGALLYFKKTEKGIEFDRKVELGMVGHPPYAAWFCGEHVEEARKHTGFTLEQAMARMSLVPCAVNSYIFEKKPLLEPFRGEDRDLVEEAYEMAKKIHEHQSRDNGDPYLTHPYRVAMILIYELGIKDADLIASALLHDVIEDGDVEPEELENKFNANVASLVFAVSKPKERTAGWENRYYEGIKSSGRQAMLLKLCDRLDNIRDLPSSPSMEKRKRYLKETREVYLPWARDLDSRIYRLLQSEVVKLEGSK